MAMKFFLNIVIWFQKHHKNAQIACLRGMYITITAQLKIIGAETMIYRRSRPIEAMMGVR